MASAPAAFLSRLLSSLFAVVLVSKVLPAPPRTRPRASPTLAQLIGQKLVIRMDGTTPSASLLGRVQRGEIGGIVLFGFNITTKSALTAAVSKLQAAAAAGGQPPLFIMVDQEGGTVRRIPWAGPTMSARQMGIDGQVALVTQQGSSTAAALHTSSINVNLAPVADVADSTASFMYQQGRTFGFSNTRVGRLALAFANGTGAQDVIPVFKHFPGIGRATRNTDASRSSSARRARRSRRTCTIPARDRGGGAPMLMLSNATYMAWDSTNGAGWSKAVGAFLRNRPRLHGRDDHRLVERPIDD